MKSHITLIPSIVPIWFITLALATTAPLLQAAETTTEQQIQAIISSTYDKPEHKVETSPIAVVEDYAVADWIQGKRGGRALLHRINGQWTIMACGADGLKQVETLTEAGISLRIANDLVQKLTTAEDAVDSDRVKRFSLFGTKNDPVSDDYHHTHSNQ